MSLNSCLHDRLPFADVVHTRHTERVSGEHAVTQTSLQLDRQLTSFLSLHLSTSLSLSLSLEQAAVWFKLPPPPMSPPPLTHSLTTFVLFRHAFLLSSVGSVSIAGLLLQSRMLLYSRAHQRVYLSSHEDSVTRRHCFTDAFNVEFHGFATHARSYFLLTLSPDATAFATLTVSDCVYVVSVE